MTLQRGPSVSLHLNFKALDSQSPLAVFHEHPSSPCSKLLPQSHGGVGCPQGM